MIRTRLRTLVATLLVSLGAGACAQPPQDPEPIVSTATDEAAIREVALANDAVMMAEDLDGLLARYADDVVRMDAGRPVMRGLEAIREAYVTRFAAWNFDVTSHVLDVKVAGDLAVARTSWTSHGVPADGGPEYQITGKSVLTFQRQTDGSWKIVWEIWNRDVAAP